jgi:hypothetical protein
LNQVQRNFGAFETASFFVFKTKPFHVNIELHLLKQTILLDFLTHSVTFNLRARFDWHSFASFYKNSFKMRLVFFVTILFVSLSLSAKEQSLTVVDQSFNTEITASSQIDKKKQRKKKRMNKKRRKACHNWANRSYAG